MSNPSVYAPSPEFVQRAHVKGMEGYRELYRRAAEKPEEFWGELAERELVWFQKWSHVFEWNPPFAKWFVGGKINASYNCLDRHLATPPQEQGRDPVGGRAGRPAADLLPGTAPTGVPLRQRAEGPRPQGRRPRHHLHGHGSGAAGGPAGLRAAGHHPQRGVRRLLRRGAQDPHPGPGSAGGDHLRRRPGGAARKSGSRTPWTRPWRRAPACATRSCYRRTGGAVHMREGRDHWWHDLD